MDSKVTKREFQEAEQEVVEAADRHVHEALPVGRLLLQEVHPC